ncbi:DinB family protein [Priestia megaterium]|uniref:DinB family protein n=1 Tax=Priestia megaterium TaxID=1404 RepID=UPI00101DCC56|nr:DinB family protein [Priestia megaterium]
METTIVQLNEWVIKLPKKLEVFSQAAASSRPAPKKWSPKEIVGHLCDSAIHNLQRFINVQHEKKPCVLTPYKQDEWVELQHYQDTPIEEVVALWRSLNKQIASVLSHIPTEKHMYQFELDDGNSVSLEWLAKDYINHLEHHIKQIDAQLPLGGKEDEKRT